MEQHNIFYELRQIFFELLFTYVYVICTPLCITYLIIIADKITINLLLDDTIDYLYLINSRSHILGIGVYHHYECSCHHMTIHASSLAHIEYLNVWKIFSCISPSHLFIIFFQIYTLITLDN